MIQLSDSLDYSPFLSCTARKFLMSISPNLRNENDHLLFWYPSSYRTAFVTYLQNLGLKSKDLVVIKKYCHERSLAFVFVELIMEISSLMLISEKYNVFIKHLVLCFSRIATLGYFSQQVRSCNERHKIDYISISFMTLSLYLFTMIFPGCRGD